MAPKRPAAEAAASGSASDASDAEADASHHPSSPSPSKTPPPPNPNPKAPPAAPAPAAEDSAAAGSDSGAAYDSDADNRPAPPKPATSPSRRAARRSPKPRSRSPTPEANSDSDGSAAPAASDADPAAGDGADSEDGDASPLPAPRPSRPEAAAVKPLSSRPMDPPRRSLPSFSEPRSKRPRSAAVPAVVEQLKRPSRLWSPGDELVILRGLTAYRAKHGVIPGSMQDISKLHGQIGNELSVKVTTTQVSDKVRRLKQKYNQLAARTKNGRDPEFPTPQDRSVYDLGKKVWGPIAGAGAGGGNAIVEYDGGDSDEEQRQSSESDGDTDSGRDDRDRKNKRLKPITMANGNGPRLGATMSACSRGKVEFEKGKDAYPYLWETVEDLSRQQPNGAVFKKAFEMIEGTKARGMEEKLRKFRVAEVRHQLRRMELMKETVKMVLDALEG